MGALQPGLQSPAMLPEDWPLLIMDLKDYDLVTWVGRVPRSNYQAAREAHKLFHQNARGLVQTFGISKSEATAIVKACPQCSFHNGGVGLGLGVNPRGTEANMLWQM
ncbi:POK18 protein, partial [Centropus bengalensis]|nr:POK18 protein [Centropus bengalensis]